MVSQKELLEEYDSVKVLAGNVYFFQDEMRDYTYNYWLSSSSGQDLIVVCQDEASDSLALNVLNSVSSGEVKPSSPTVFELKQSAAGFSHVFVVPCNYHGYLKGVESIDRKDLFLCLPIYRCEFSGSETEEEFRELRLHYIPVLDWNREAHPKLRIYFDNPKTGGGTDEVGAFYQWPALLREIGDLNGVSNGFIEITNWSGVVMEILSPSAGEYILIKNRQDEQLLSLDDLLAEIKSFAFT